MQKCQCVNCRSEAYYVCRECNQGVCKSCVSGHDWTHSKLYNVAPKVSQNWSILRLNLVCTLCYNGDGTFILFRKKTIHKICRACKEVLVSQGEQVFDPEWESLLIKDKSPTRSTERSQRLRELTEAFKAKERNFNDEGEVLERFVNNGLLENNKKLYEKQKNLIMQKKEETREFFKRILLDAKEQLGNAEISEHTIGGRLLKICAENKEIKELNDINMISTLNENKEQFLQNLRAFPVFKYIPAKEFVIPKVLYYFLGASNRVFKITLPNRTCESKSASVNWKLYANWCVLNNNEIIYSGGEDYGCSGKTFKISYNNLENPQQLTSCVAVSHHSNIYYKGYVYSLGGSYPYAQRLNLTTNQWENISIRIGELGLTTTCTINQGILIGGQLSKNILLYNVGENKLEKLSSEFSSVHCKLLLKGERYVYCLCNNYLFKNNLSSLATWEKIGEIQSKKWFSYSQGVCIENEIYFINDEDRELWKLDCNTDQLERVSTNISL
ncbi:unnamed protein product [Blepharisma stoltei]|uniref:B box-type domain-containing protein n=1 Tax=Blepharisma stoltei TaxID=1481888 RepID=A0AAU9J4Q2_9CILI|nr:unnamed protein product [Blepharisma stoltei]